MKKRLIYTVALLPVLSYGMSFNALSERACDVSGEIVQRTGYWNASKYEKAAALAQEPMSIETSGRAIRGDDPKDSGAEYGMMVDWTIKMPQLYHAQEREYDLGSESRLKEIRFEQSRIKVQLKRELLLADLEKENIKIAAEKVKSAKEAHAIGVKKQNAGRMSQMEVLRLETEYDYALQEQTKMMMEYDHIQHRLQEMTMLNEEVRADDLSFAYLRGEDQIESKVNNAAPVLALGAEIETIDAQIETLRRSTVESVSVGIGATREPTQNSIDFRLSIPLALSGKNENKIAALMSQRSALIHKREIMMQKLSLSVHALMEHLKERELSLSEAANVERRYEKLFEIAQKGFEGGVVTQFEYLATKNAFYEARLRSTELKRNYIEEMGEIEERIGGIWE